MPMPASAAPTNPANSEAVALAAQTPQKAPPSIMASRLMFRMPARSEMSSPSAANSKGAASASVAANSRTTALVSIISGLAQHGRRLGPPTVGQSLARAVVLEGDLDKSQRRQQIDDRQTLDDRAYRRGHPGR